MKNKCSRIITAQGNERTTIYLIKQIPSEVIKRMYEKSR